MTVERGAASALKGRLADVYFRALVEGSVEALSRRLGNRATIEDPLFGRASTLSSIDPLLVKCSARFRDAKATYRHVASATGVDRDVSEGIVRMVGPSGAEIDVPMLVVAERRRLREIELRVYYASLAPTASRRSRAPIMSGDEDVAIPQIVSHVVDALRKGAVERVLSAFEEGSRWVDPVGNGYAKKDGSMAGFIADLGDRLDLVSVGAADDGRTCCLETLLTRPKVNRDPEPATFSFERGESGLLRELRLYYEP